MSLNTILATAPLTATGYHLKATGTALGQSLIWDNGTNVGIGNQGTTYALDITGNLRSTTSAYFATSSGNVGIGTVSPNITGYTGTVLTVGNGTSNSFGIEVYGGTTGADGSVGDLAFLNSYATGADKRIAIIRGLRTNDNNSGGLTIYSKNAGTLTQAMTIAPSGAATFSSSVGVGGTSAGNFSGVTFTGPFLDVAGILQIKGTSANTIAGLQFGGDTYRKALIYSSVGTDTPYLAFSVAASGSSSSASEAMRITSGGNMELKIPASTTQGILYKDSSGVSRGKIYYDDIAGTMTFGTMTGYATIFVTNNTTSMTIASGGEVTFANSIILGTNQRIKTSGGAGNITGSGQTTITSTIATIFSGFLLGGVQTGNLVIVNGVKSGTGWNFTDLVFYMTNGTIVVISSTTVNTPPARTYSVSGNDLRLLIAGGDTGFCSCTAITQGYQA